MFCLYFCSSYFYVILNGELNIFYAFVTFFHGSDYHIFCLIFYRVRNVNNLIKTKYPPRFYNFLKFQEPKKCKPCLGCFRQHVLETHGWAWDFALICCSFGMSKKLDKFISTKTDIFYPLKKI